MHEFSIAENIVNLVLRAAKEHRLERVDAITVEAGALRQIVPESLLMAFDALKAAADREELMGNCRLNLVAVPQLVRCRDCDAGFVPEDWCYLCPACGSIETEVVAGNELVIKSIEGEQQE